MKNILYTLILFCSLGFAQQTPGAKQTKAVTIVGATAHIGNGKVIDNSIIIFEKGKITLVADATVSKVTHKGRVIQAAGKHVYPGFIAPNSTLGLVEIDAVRASNDMRETGSYNPHIRSIIAYNTESKVTETMRPNGVLQAQIVPRGGVISGTSSIVQLDAWNYEDALIKENDGLHINWPRTFSWSWSERKMTANKKYSEQLKKLTDFFIDAKYYDSTKGANLKLESMQDVLERKRRVFIHLNDEKQIIDAVNFAKSHHIKIVLVGAHDAYKTTELLKLNNIPVLLQRVHSTPDSQDDDYDLPYKLAYLLDKEGLLVGLETSGDMERMNSRNLPFYAGTCVAFGLDKEKAVQLISLNTAKILGIDSFTGSLEAGKDATLFISEGDALDMRTNKLTEAFIQGRKVSLESHQTHLYKKFSKKYQ